MMYNAKAASIATGIPEATLRSWERRYGVPKPARNAVGQRLYTQEDIDLIKEMSALLERGVSASLAAQAVRRGREATEEEEARGPIDLLLTLSKVATYFPNGSINIYDRELRYVFAEGLGLAAIGLSSEMLVGRRLADLFSTESLAEVEPYYREAFAGKGVFFELDVAGHQYSIAAGPLDTNSEGVQTIIAVAQDISAWRTPASSQHVGQKENTMPARRVITVEPDGNSWKLDGGTGTYQTQKEAIAAGREQAKKAELGQLRIKGKDGRFQKEYTYGKDPQPLPD